MGNWAKMKPNYSIFPGLAGTIKPAKKDYANQPPIGALVSRDAEGRIAGPDEGFWLPYTFQRGLLDARLEEYVSKDTAPIPATEDREGYYGSDHVHWWWMGLVSWLTFRHLYNRYHGPLTPGDVYFEPGCATGRILRHALFQGPELEVIGCDLNIRHIDWMQHFLPARARVFQNHALPFLPLEDNSVDFAVASSVFTHIDDLESGWLMEMRRVMRRGGLFFATIASDAYWLKCGSNPAYAFLLNDFLPMHSEYELTVESFRKPMPAPRVVLTYPGNDCYNSVVFHSMEYIRNTWNRYFQVADIIEGGEGLQDIVVLRKT